MNAQRKAVLETLAYFDLCDFAPTLLDMQKWLLHCEQAMELEEIHSILMSEDGIVAKEGVYVFSGREELVALRREKYNHWHDKWKHARFYMRLIAMMPFVRGVWFVNSMGWTNVKENSDIDLCIVAAPGHIWTARFFTTALMKLFRQRPEEQEHKKALCLSMYMTQDHLDIEQYKIGPEDIYYAFWALQLYPVYDDGLYADFQAKNPWLKEIFAERLWTQPIPQRRIRLTGLERLVKWVLELVPLEEQLKKLQMRIMPQYLKSLAGQGTAVVLQDDIIKLHTKDARAEYLEQWKKRSQEVLT